MVFPNATITMQNGRSSLTQENYPNLNKMHNEIRVISNGDGVKLIAGDIDKNALNSGTILTDLPSTQVVKSVWEKSYPISIDNGDGTETPISAFLIDLRGKITIEPNKKVTANTTSPGFTIEKGKVKCYRKSSLNDFLYKDKYFVLSYDPKHINCTKELYKYFKAEYVRSGTSIYPSSWNDSTKNLILSRHISRENTNLTLYYTIRNIINCGREKSFVVRNNILLWNLCGERNKRITREHGLVYYKGRVQRHPFNVNRGSEFVTRANNQSMITVKFSGMDGGQYVFLVTKPETDTDIEIKKVGVKFVGTDGNLHEGYVTPVNQEGRLQTGELTGATMYCDNLIVKNKINVRPDSERELSTSGYNVFGGTVKSTYVVFEFNSLEQTKRVGFYTDVATTKLNGYAKWKPLSMMNNWWGDGHGIGDHNVRCLPRKFERRHLNTCMYVKKYKGVKSEYPEIFYTR